MIDYVASNAIRIAATKCKAEMEATKDLNQRRSIIDRYLAPLKVKFGIDKTILQHEIYCLTYDK